MNYFSQIILPFRNQTKKGNILFYSLFIYSILFYSLFIYLFILFYSLFILFYFLFLLMPLFP